MILTGAGVYDILAGRPGVQVVTPQDPRCDRAAIRGWRSGEGREGLEATRTWLREEYALDTYVTRMEHVYADVLGADSHGRGGGSERRAPLSPQPSASATPVDLHAQGQRLAHPDLRIERVGRCGAAAEATGRAPPRDSSGDGREVAR